jgi:hypothetical protein
VTASSATRPPGTLAGVRGPLAVTGVAFLLGYAQKLPCHVAGWPWQRELIFGRDCYSDVPMLFRTRGLIDGVFPYAPNAGEHPLEYPVVTGLVMDATARLTRLFAGSDPATASRTFYELTVLLLLGCALVTVWAVARTALATGGRPGDALFVAAAPTLALAGTINWDLLAAMAAALAILAWARERPALAGACLGLGTAAKLYPALLFGALLVLAVRSRRFAPLLPALGTALVTWVAVNLPVALAYPDGWRVFWTFNTERGADFGSVWYALDLLGVKVPGLNAVAGGLFLLACAGIAALGLRARRPATFAQLAFLVVAAFCVTNKVYSPQYVLWMLPLAVLARAGAPLPRVVRDWLIWQAAEVAYWWLVWKYLAGELAGAWMYPVGIYVRIAVTLYLAAQVVRDVLRADVLRADVLRADVLQAGGRYAGDSTGVQDRPSRETAGGRLTAANPSESATIRPGSPDVR